MLLTNTSWRKDGNRVTILKNSKLNYNGKVCEYVLEGTRIEMLTWGDHKEIVENNRLCGWDEELPLFNPYDMAAWQRFLYMFFRHQYQGDEIETGEMDTEIWNLWKEHYLNVNESTLKSPRDRNSLRLSRSPTCSPIASPVQSPRNSFRGSPLRSDAFRSSPDLTRFLK